MSNVNTISTAVEQAFFVLAKEDKVVASDVFYPENAQNEFVQLAVETTDFPGVTGSDLTRIAALAGVVQVLDSIPADYTRFTNIYTLNLVVGSKDRAIAWIQRFRATEAAEAQAAKAEGRDARVLTHIKANIKTKEGNVEIKVTKEEIILWQEFFLQLGVKPFVNVYNTKSAYQFRDGRKDKNDLRIKAGWNKLAELGADVKEYVEEKAEPAIRINLGFGAKAAVDATEENVG